VPKQTETERALELLTYGLYVVTTAKDGRTAAFLTSWLSQVSAAPPAVALSVPEGSPAHELLAGGAPLVVNILRAGQKSLAEHFLGEPEGDDPLRGAPAEPASNGVPRLSEALAILECEVEGSVQIGGRALFVAGVSGARVLTDGQPLTARQAGLPPR
jgi:flavin reductase (DIM6/NTAB) family NADH-FMN oxidoreductase RutF